MLSTMNKNFFIEFKMIEKGALLPILFILDRSKNIISSRLAELMS